MTNYPDAESSVIFTVDLPPALYDWVQARVDAGEYASSEDYLIALVRRDQAGWTVKTSSTRNTVAATAPPVDGTDVQNP